MEELVIRNNASNMTEEQARAKSDPISSWSNNATLLTPVSS